MPGMQEVHIDDIPIDRLASLLDDERVERMVHNAERARELLDGRVVWNVNATASGGGVAEMLQGLLAYSRGAGVDARWLVLDGNPDFFKITKRIHNLLHGMPGDGGPLGDEEHEAYAAALAPNLDFLREKIGADDIVLLHDPQTAGLVEGLLETKASVLWRSHIGRDTTNDCTDLAWKFLRGYVEKADATIFSRQEYVPDWLEPKRLRIIPPSLDPFSAKNAELSDVDVATTLQHVGLVDLPDGGSVEFSRRDGSQGRVRDLSGLYAAGGVIPRDARLVMQVSRWDRLKDMAGVMSAFSDHLVRMPEDVHLALVGPDVLGVSDDPEGAEVLEECLQAWKAMPVEARDRIHLAALPMDDVDENAHIVNALQRHAVVVVQKSIVEGFGLTVTEPMWKARAVVASKVGGIQDQIVDGENGLLLADPTDLDAFADALVAVLADPAFAERLGTAARERVRDQYLGDRHLIQYVELFAELL